QRPRRLPPRVHRRRDRGVTRVSERMPAREFHQADGVEDWRGVGGGACADFRTGSFADAVGLADAVGRVGGVDGPPDLDMRRDGLTVRLITIGEDYFGLSRYHIDQARQISAVARELGAEADPSRVQTFQVTIDALISVEVMPFWRAVLDYAYRGDTPD